MARSLAIEGAYVCAVNVMRALRYRGITLYDFKRRGMERGFRISLATIYSHYGREVQNSYSTMLPHIYAHLLCIPVYALLDPAFDPSVYGKKGRSAQKYRLDVQERSGASV